MMAVKKTMLDYESPMELVDSAEVIPETSKEVPVAPSPETPKTDEPEAPKPEDPVETKQTETLFDLPDGRKVSAEVLQKEWKENFLPDYTRKSQKLAEIERGNEKENTNTRSDEPKWKNPDYVPENYAEVIEFAKAEALNEIRRASQLENERVSAIQREVDGQISAIKATDPKLDENALFQHANKYGFQDLKAAHANMMDMRRAVLETEQRTVKNIKGREADPVGGGASGATSADDGYDPRVTSQFTSALDYLARVKGN